MSPMLPMLRSSPHPLLCLGTVIVVGGSYHIPPCHCILSNNIRIAVIFYSIIKSYDGVLLNNTRDLNKVKCDVSESIG